MLERILEEYKVTLGAALWTICVIIIPLTLWFTAISYRIDEVSSKVFVLSEDQAMLRATSKDLDTKISNKLDLIHADLGIVKGELRRIKN